MHMTVEMEIFKSYKGSRTVYLKNLMAGCCYYKTDRVSGRFGSDEDVQKEMQNRYGIQLSLIQAGDRGDCENQHKRNGSLLI